MDKRDFLKCAALAAVAGIIPGGASGQGAPPPGQSHVAHQSAPRLIAEGIAGFVAA